MVPGLPGLEGLEGVGGVVVPHQEEVDGEQDQLHHGHRPEELGLAGLLALHGGPGGPGGLGGTAPPTLAAPSTSIIHLL